MTDRRWLFEQQPVGTTATTSNTQSETGDNLNTLADSSGGTRVYDDAWSFPAGGKSLKLTNGTTGALQVRIAPAAAHSIGAMDVSFRWAAEVPETRTFLRVRHASGYIFSILRNTSGRMVVQNAASAVIGTGAVTLPTTAGVRFEVLYDLASGANSDITVNAYSVAGALLDTLSFTNIDLGAGAYSVATAEVFHAGATAIDLWVDSWGIRDHSNTPMGPYEVPVLPIGGVAATRMSSLTVSLDWTHPADAPNGVSIARAAGVHILDGDGLSPGDTGYDPLTIAGASVVTTGETSPPYVDTVPAPGEYTYWVARTEAP